MPVILVLAVLAVLLLSRSSSASSAGGFGTANQAPPWQPSNTPDQNQALVDQYTNHQAPVAAGTYQVYTPDGQPTPVRETVTTRGCTAYTVLRKTVYSPAGCQMAPPPPPPAATNLGPPPPPPPPPPVKNAWSGAGHF